jgi:hypothetical protein
VQLIRQQLQPNTQVQNRDGFLDDLVELDEQQQTMMDALANGQGIPSEILPRDFQKAVRILEDAIRGFTIGRHGNFWAGKTRDQFIATIVFGVHPGGIEPGW